MIINCICFSTLIRFVQEIQVFPLIFVKTSTNFIKCAFNFVRDTLECANAPFNFVYCRSISLNLHSFSLFVYPFSSIANQIRRSQWLGKIKQNQFRLLAFIFVRISIKIVTRTYSVINVVILGFICNISVDSIIKAHFVFTAHTTSLKSSQYPLQLCSHNTLQNNTIPSAFLI